jgi:hypothetical protein
VTQLDFLKSCNVRPADSASHNTKSKLPIGVPQRVR